MSNRCPKCYVKKGDPHIKGCNHDPNYEDPHIIDIPKGGFTAKINEFMSENIDLAIEYEARLADCDELAEENGKLLNLVASQALKIDKLEKRLAAVFD